MNRIAHILVALVAVLVAALPASATLTDWASVTDKMARQGASSGIVEGIVIAAYGTQVEAQDGHSSFRCSPPGLAICTGAGDHAQQHRLHNRYYNPVVGRFLSVDPVGGSVGNPQTWNRYAYVTGNPIGIVDPTGEAGQEVADSITGDSEEAQRAYALLKANSSSANDGSVGGVAKDAALATVADIGTGLAATGDALGDLLRVGTSTGEVLAGDVSGLDAVGAVNQDFVALLIGV